MLCPSLLMPHAHAHTPKKGEEEKSKGGFACVETLFCHLVTLGANITPHLSLCL